ncbi:TniQ family protein [Streptomyces apricus]|uniref:TniQ family protein n=1 Tax=Streptomyces apricus TaxID=1828112 RepID=A0A5B0APU0_9ACTN|nr:TniQ family protein [Streptomyces apricus]KAA0930575.1 TniQ family protein [Streptomyces apricus]
MPTSLRRLALVPDPYPGESLLSWVDALAGLNQISRLQAMRFAAFIRPGGSSYYPSEYFVAHLPTEAMARVRVTTGLSATQLRRMTLMHYTDGVLPPPPISDPRAVAAWLKRLHLVHPVSSRACPACLEESGGRWPLRWRLIWSFACARHRVFLLSTCQGCGKGLHQVLPDPRSLAMCGQYKGDHPGNTCLRSIWHMRPPQLLDPHLLECQRRLNELVDHPHRQGTQSILRTLRLALENIRINYDEAPSLPDTDVILHRRWHNHDGALWYADDPLLMAAFIKVATLGGLSTSQDSAKQADMASWSTDGFPQLYTDGPPVNRFGGKCRAIACPSWVPPGQGYVAYAKDEPYVLCSAHVDHAVAPGG